MTEADPLGALSTTTSPTSMQKSATAIGELVLVGGNANTGSMNKRPSLQDDILGAPFSGSTVEMSRSSTMPLSGELEAQGGQKGYFSMASIKNMTKSGTSKLTNFKKNAYLSASASAWMSPNSKESLNKGISSLRSAYSSAAGTVSKKMSEFREQQNTPSKNSLSSSNPNLLNNKDEDTLSNSSMNDRRPSEYPVDQPDSWSNFTGQIWEQFWSYSYKEQPSNFISANMNPKTFAELFEELYEKMPDGIVRAAAMELIMTSCSLCKNCGAILYDEEIIAGWTAEDSNLNTKCQFCNKMVVPHLTIKINDHR